MAKKLLSFVLNTALLLIFIAFVSSPFLISQKTLTFWEDFKVLSGKTSQNFRVISRVSDYGNLLQEELGEDKTTHLSYTVFPSFEAEYEKIYLVQNISDEEMTFNINIAENSFSAKITFDGGQTQIKLKPNQAANVSLLAKPSQEAMETKEVVFSLSSTLVSQILP